MDDKAKEQYLSRLRGYRNRKDYDFSMDFMRADFKRDVEKPYKQLAAMVEVWEEIVPRELAVHTKLESLNRGVLKVVVESSSWLYELDQKLRSGMQTELVKGYRGKAFRKVQLRVDRRPFVGRGS
ncbi:DciA family protein [Poriferisphaera sp. WC338]|uniref:DciA family protein n=1 Tax=Poriferisphaera sp. WC338 TaxID=3425129 RepID=UPI003D818EEF